MCVGESSSRKGFPKFGKPLNSVEVEEPILLLQIKMDELFAMERLLELEEKNSQRTFFLLHHGNWGGNGHGPGHFAPADKR